ncbi:TBC1 domain family member 15 isoform X2 [Nematostella vectensis]|nr:TBC1 domain family member 15 isoform X2 [Nematostella vectensis]
MSCTKSLPPRGTQKDCSDCSSELSEEFCELELVEPESPSHKTERTGPLEKQEWTKMMDQDGRIINESGLRKAVFKGGVSSQLRKEVWRFLYGLYPFSSTQRERQVILAENYTKYNAQKNRWKQEIDAYQNIMGEPGGMAVNPKPLYIRECEELCKLKHDPEEKESQRADAFGSIHDNQRVFLDLTAKVNASRQVIDIEKLNKSIRSIDKDVPRTDRAHPFFKGQGNPNLIVLRDILITYAAYHQDVGYAQGMNDILSRFLVVLVAEDEAYSCFANYMEHVKGDFLDSTMMNKIELVGKLLKQMDRQLEQHFTSNDMGDLLFVHRWLVLGFKREFCFEEALKLFEILSSQHLELSSIEADRERYKQRSRNREKDGGQFHTELLDLDSAFSFDLFVCLAVLREHRYLFLKCKEVSGIYNTMNSISMKMDLNTILVKAEDLFFHYCRKSVMDCFEVVDSLEATVSRKNRAL